MCIRDRIAGDLDAVRAWVARWEKAGASGKPVRLERREIGGRLVGRNELPGRAWVDSYDAVWSLLGVRGKVEDFDRLVAPSTDARIAGWAHAQPAIRASVDGATRRSKSSTLPRTPSSDHTAS